MLHIYFKPEDTFDDILTEDNYRIQPTLWFDYQGGADYIIGDIEQQIIADIDKATVISTGNINFPVFGNMSPDKLSGTAKTLILANNEPGIYVNGDFVGNNGYKWILHLAEAKDIYLHASCIMHFYADFPAHIINDDSHISTWSEFLIKGVECLYGRDS